MTGANEISVDAAKAAAPSKILAFSHFKQEQNLALKPLTVRVYLGVDSWRCLKVTDRFVPVSLSKNDCLSSRAVD